MRILIAEDQRDLNKILAKKLTAEGYSVDACFDGEEAQLPVPAISYGKEGDGISEAHNLFTVLRELDRKGAKTVYARCPLSDGVSMAVYNRLIRAAAFRVVEV